MADVKLVRDTFQYGMRHQNVGTIERVVSVVAGAAVVANGFKRSPVAASLLGVLGGSLLHRGITGSCPVYEALGIDTSGKDGTQTLPVEQGVKFDMSVVVNRPAPDLYRYWRDFRNLPGVMSHLVSVKDLGNGRSHWVAKAPFGSEVSWDAVLINDKPEELIAWRSTAHAEVNNAGSVRFIPLQGGQSTQVRVSLKYDPPAGAVGAVVARILGEAPEQQLSEDLARFKEMMERFTPEQGVLPGTT